MSTDDVFERVMRNALTAQGEASVFGGVDRLLRTMVDAIRPHDALTLVQGEAVVRGVGRALVAEFERRVDAAAGALLEELVRRGVGRQA